MNESPLTSKYLLSNEQPTGCKLRGLPATLFVDTQGFVEKVMDTCTVTGCTQCIGKNFADLKK